MEKIGLYQLWGILGYRICSGNKYSANCYGKHARIMRFGNDDNLVFAECVFDTENLMVYELGFLLGQDEKGETIRYLWRHPDFKAAYRKESALLRATSNFVERPYKQVSLDGVLDSIRNYLNPK